MAILRKGFTAILLVCAVNASRTPESARDQYKLHEDLPRRPQLPSEATDQVADVRQPLQVSFIKNRNSTAYNEHPAPPTKGADEKETVNRKEDLRQKRYIDPFGRFSLGGQYYSQWGSAPIATTFFHVPPLQSYSIWRPQYYQISRPYFIPVWGSPGRIPLYFPPQPLYANPGYPIHNPPAGTLQPGKGYLPPDPNKPTPAPESNSTSTVELIDKINDDGPVWGTVPAMKPTRRPRPQGQRTTTHPPLVHDVGGSRMSTTTARTPISTTRIPIPPRDSENQITAAPPAPPAESSQPSKCVWAIVSCCSGTKEVSYRCFEQLGCGGPFWDSNPCDSEFAHAAVANVMKYYNAK